MYSLQDGQGILLWFLVVLYYNGVVYIFISLFPMTDTQILQELLIEVKWLSTRFDGIEANLEWLGKKVEWLEVSFEWLGKKVDGITENLAEFQIKQEDFNTAIWNLNTQAFSAISDIRSEVVAPWKIRQSR
jgi:archaellum component FlaC